LRPNYPIEVANGIAKEKRRFGVGGKKEAY